MHLNSGKHVTIGTLLSHRGAWRDMIADIRGATAVEFAIIASLLLMLTFGILEFGLGWYDYNMGAAAAQRAVRYAVESDPVAEFFNPYLGYNGVLDGGLAAGSNLSLANLPVFEVDCTGSGSGSGVTASCTCSGTCPSLTTQSGSVNATTADNTAFQNILSVVQSVYLTAQASNLEVDYKHIGLGFAGSSGINIIPQVTVKLNGLTYNFVALGAFGFGSITMPNFQSTLIAEDLSSCSPDNTTCP